MKNSGGKERIDYGCFLIDFFSVIRLGSSLTRPGSNLITKHSRITEKFNIYLIINMYALYFICTGRGYMCITSTGGP